MMPPRALRWLPDTNSSRRKLRGLENPLSISILARLWAEYNSLASFGWADESIIRWVGHTLIHTSGIHNVVPPGCHTDSFRVGESSSESFPRVPPTANAMGPLRCPALVGRHCTEVSLKPTSTFRRS